MAYVVEISEAAAAAHEAVAEYRSDVGERVRFDSRADAEALATTFGEKGAAVVLRGIHEDHPLTAGQSAVDAVLDAA